MFQPTHPHGVRPLRYKTDQIQLAFQPTHPHGVRLVTPDVTASAYNVSTHAPARGATAPGGPHFLLYHRFNPRTRTGCDIMPPVSSGFFVSTHAPARGATLIAVRTTQMYVFQPTHPHGVRQ